MWGLTFWDREIKDRFYTSISFESKDEPTEAIGFVADVLQASMNRRQP